MGKRFFNRDLLFSLKVLTLKFYFRSLFYLAWERTSHEVPKTEAEANNQHQQDRSEPDPYFTGNERRWARAPSALLSHRSSSSFRFHGPLKWQKELLQQARLQMKWSTTHVNQARPKVLRHPGPTRRRGFLPAFRIAYCAVI